MKRMKKNKQKYFSGYKNLLVATVFIVTSVIFLSEFTKQVTPSKDVSYTQFEKMAQEGQVKELYVEGQEAQGRLEDGSRFHTRFPENVNWKALVDAYELEVRFGSPANQAGYWYLFPFLSLMLAMLLAWYFLRQSRGSNSGGSGGGPNIFNMGKSRARMFLPSTIGVKFNDVAGAQGAKNELQNIINYLKHPEKYRQLGAKVSRGVLLVGEPGNGKTLLAKAVAGEANVPFFSITGSDFIEVFVGVGAARVRDLFAQAHKHSPCIIFIDEIDAIGRARGSGMGGGHDEREQTLNQLLTEMDGFASEGSNIIVLAATNMPEVLDKALLRPGRFDCRIDVPYPDEAAREQILHIHARRMKLSDDVDIHQLALDTAGFSGAELADLLNKAAVEAARHNDAWVTAAHIDQARAHILASQKAIKPQANPASGDNSLARMYKPSQIKTNFASIAGMEDAKEEVNDIIQFLRNPEHYSRLGAKMSKGLLLVGEPGNGKTLLARAMAGEANCPFFSISGSEFVQKYVGVGAARVRDLFAQARKHKPSIIFIDEIDAVGMHRAADGGSGGQSEHNQTLNQLLTELDGFDTKDEPIIVIGATNRADTLDKALMRPGRFDRRVHVLKPRKADRLKILELYAKDFKLDDSVDLDKLARGTIDFSSAAIANLMNEAALIASRNPDRDAITMADFEEARDKILVGKQAKSLERTQKEIKETAYHEAGHALMHILQPEHAMPLHKVTVLARGGALGIAWGLPETDLDMSLETKESALANIRIALGGRAAEELVFGLQSSGASNDFEQATNTAQRMVRYFGMCDELGPVTYDRQRGLSYSDKTAERIDEAVKKILQESLQSVKETLTKHRDKLELLAQKLIEKETLDAQEVYELLGMEPRKSQRFA